MLGCELWKVFSWDWKGQSVKEKRKMNINTYYIFAVEIFGTWPWGKLITEYYIKENNLRFDARENKYVCTAFLSNQLQMAREKKEEKWEIFVEVKTNCTLRKLESSCKLFAFSAFVMGQVSVLVRYVIWKVVIQFLTLSNYFLPTQQTFFFIVINKDGDLTAVQKYILCVNRLFWNVIPIVKHNTYVNISFTFYILETNFNWTESALHISTSFQVIIVSIIGTVFYFFGILSQV